MLLLPLRFDITDTPRDADSVVDKRMLRAICY